MRVELTIAMLLAGTALAAPAYAQTAPQPPAPPTEEATPEAAPEVVVVGSQIRGKVTQALPVTVIDAKQIDASGALSGDE